MLTADLISNRFIPQPNTLLQNSKLSNEDVLVIGSKRRPDCQLQEIYEKRPALENGKENKVAPENKVLKEKTLSNDFEGEGNGRSVQKIYQDNFYSSANDNFQRSYQNKANPTTPSNVVSLEHNYDKIDPPLIFDIRKPIEPIKIIRTNTPVEAVNDKENKRLQWNSCFICGDMHKIEDIKVKCVNCINVMHKVCAGYQRIDVKEHHCPDCTMKQVWTS